MPTQVQPSCGPRLWWSLCSSRTRSATCCAAHGAASHRITWHCSATTSRDARHPGLEPCTRRPATHTLGPRRGQATHSRSCTCCRTPTSRRSCSATAATPRSPPPSARAPSAAWRATCCARPPPSPPTSTRSSLRAATAHSHRPTRSPTPPRPLVGMHARTQDWMRVPLESYWGCMPRRTLKRGPGPSHGRPTLRVPCVLGAPSPPWRLERAASRPADPTTAFDHSGCAPRRRTTTRG